MLSLIESLSVKANLYFHFSDESTRPDRQPEFTQLDIELSFTDREHIIALVENILTYSLPDRATKVVTPFQRISYDDAMEKYGCDKPDTRFEMTVNDRIFLGYFIGLENNKKQNFPLQLNNVTSIIATNSNLTENVNDFAAYAIPFKYESGKRFHDDLDESYSDFVKTFKGKMYNAKIQLDVDKWAAKNIGCLSEESALNLAKTLDVEKGDRIFLAFGPKEETVSLIDSKIYFHSVSQSNSRLTSSKF